METRSPTSTPATSLYLRTGAWTRCRSSAIDSILRIRAGRASSPADGGEGPPREPPESGLFLRFQVAGQREDSRQREHRERLDEQRGKAVGRRAPDDRGVEPEADDDGRRHARELVLHAPHALPGDPRAGGQGG